MIDINFKDAKGAVEYTIEYDPANGKIRAWHVYFIEEISFHTIINIPMLIRQMAGTPCPGSDSAPIAASGQGPGPMVIKQDERVRKIRIGRDGTPPIVER